MIASLLLSVSIAAPAPLFAPVEDNTDLIVLEDGKEVFCRVLFEDDEVVIARSRRKEREYPRSEVAEVHSIERSLRRFLEQFDNIDQTSVQALGDLAIYCEAEELHGEARNLWLRILTLDPENEQAWTKLGGSKGRKGWRLKVRGRYYTIDRLRERVSDWKNALELRTAHFLLKTDVTPERALDLAIDMERAYQTFYELLAPELRLFVFDEIPEVHVFASGDDFPTPPTPAGAWFSFGANTVYVNGSEEGNAAEIIQKFTHLLFFNSFHRTLGKTGSIAPWARDGMANVFALAVRPDPGHTRWEFGQPYLPWFRAQAQDEDRVTLKELLRGGLVTFQDATESTRYSAASYTLVQFLIHANEGAYRSKFAEFLRSSYLGKGSAKHFERILEAEVEDIEVQWLAYVGSVAGS